MTHPEMLEKLGLSADEHKELMSRFSTFYNSLNERQQTVIRRTMPSADEAARSFGPGVTAEHVHSLSATEAPRAAALFAIAHGR